MAQLRKQYIGFRSYAIATSLQKMCVVGKQEVIFRHFLFIRWQKVHRFRLGESRCCKLQESDNAGLDLIARTERPGHLELQALRCDV